MNPDGLKNQIEGNIIQGVSRTLMEEVHFDASGIKSLDWRSYPVISYHAVPEIEIVLINRPEMGALGGGEPSIVPVPAAIANAIFDAIGVRLRDVPLTPGASRAPCVAPCPRRHLIRGNPPGGVGGGVVVSESVSTNC